MLRKNKDFEVDAGKDVTSKKRKTMPAEILGLKRNDEEETVLESKVFGGENQLLDRLNVVEEYSQSIGVLDKEKQKPAWQDEDDNELDSEGTSKGSTRQKARQVQFERTLGSKPLWARLKSERLELIKDTSDSDESEDESYIPLARRTGTYLTSSATLPKGELDYHSCTDANKTKRTKKVLTAVEFHKSSQVILVAGYDQTLNLFQIDGEHNPKIQSIFIENFPIHSAHFSADGNEVIMSSEFRWFYTFDMMTGKVDKIPYIKGTNERTLPKFCVSPDGKFLAFRGKYGNIYLVSAKSKEYIATLMGNGRIMDMTFSSDGSRLLTCGDDCNVYIWDVNSRRCVHKFADHGCTLGTSIGVSDNGQYVAAGSEAGIVNIYNEECFQKTSPTPLKIIKNLTTSVTTTKFSPSNEILGIASKVESAAVKMIHLPSCHAFSNFGNIDLTYIRCPTTIDFSPNSGYLCIGSSSKRALLFRLNHYDSY